MMRLDGVSVLVLDGHCAAALETVQSLGRGGAHITVAARRADALAMRSRYACTTLMQPDVSFWQLAVWLVDLDRSGRFALIVPTTELSLRAVRHLPEDHPVRLRCVVADNRSLDTALDKSRTAALADTLAIPTPRQRILRIGNDMTPGVWGWPTVLKPLTSKVVVDSSVTSPPVLIARDELCRAAYLDRWLAHTPVVEQEFIAGRGVAVTALYEHGVLRWHFTYERLHELPLTGGISTYRRALDSEPALLEAANGLLDALRWHGVAHVEFKRCPDGRFVLLEVNPRLWGSLALPILAGVDFPAGLAALATGMTLPPQPRYRVPIYARDVAADRLWWRANWHADRHDSLLMTRSPAAAAAQLIRVVTGHERWDHLCWADPGVARTILAAAIFPASHR